MSSTVFPDANKSIFPKSSITFATVSAFEYNFIIFGGLALFLPLLLLAGEPTLGLKNPIDWTFWMSVGVSAPHVYSTYVRLQRKISEKRVNYFFGFPLYGLSVLALGLAAWKGHYLEMMTAVNVWQSWHYARQVFGVSRIYANRNVETDFCKSLSYWAYHLALPLFVLGRWNMLFVAWQGKPSDVIIPMHIPDLFMTLFWIMAFIGLGVGLYSEFVKFKQSKVYNPVTVINLLVYYAIHWFGFLSIQYYLRGFFAITIFHAIQYMAILWWFEKSTRAKNSVISRVAFSENALASFAIFWALIFAFGSAVSDHILVQFNWIWVQFTAVLLGAQSAHHYAVDTVLWRSKAGK